MSAPASPADPALGKWPPTLTVMLGMMSSIMTSTMVNVAIPDIMGAFGIGQDRAHWLSTGFLAAMTVAMLLNAWFVRNIGARNTFVLANVVFVGASMMGFSSPSFDGIIVARVIQGACAGLIQPLGMSVIFTAFPPAERGKAMGIFGMGVVVGPALGPLIGGLIVDGLDWRFVFLGALPISVLAAALGTRYVPGRAANATRGRLNWISFVLVTAAVVAFLNGISQGQREGWGAPLVLALLGGAALAMLLFAEVESRTRHPLLNPRLFADRGFAVASVIGFMFGAGMFGTIYLMPIFVQTIQGFTATKAGTLLLTAEILAIAMYPVAGWLAQHYRPGYPIAAGLALFGVSAFSLTAADSDSGFWFLVGWSAVGRIGLATVFPALTASALATLAKDMVAQGAGTMNFIRMTGGAFGVNLMAILLERGASGHAALLTASQTAANDTTRSLLERTSGLLIEAGLPAGQRMALALDYLGDMIVARADGLAFRDAFMVLAIGFAVASFSALLLGARSPKPIIQER